MTSGMTCYNMMQTSEQLATHLYACCIEQVGFNSPAPNPPPALPPTVLAAFAATNATGFDNGTLLSAANASSASITSDSTKTTQPVIQTELLSLSAQPDYLVPLKVVAGLSSSFIANLVQPTRELGEAITGTEILK